MPMKLLTKELIKKFPPLYGTEDVPIPEKKVIAKFFHPFSNWRFYAVEYDPQKRLFFGLTDAQSKEWGYQSYDEIAKIKIKGLPIERDLYFGTPKIKDIKALKGIADRAPRVSQEKPPEKPRPKAKEAEIPDISQPASQKKINEALAAMGFKERLYRAYPSDGGYYYWGDGDAAGFGESGVYGWNMHGTTLADWINDLKERREKYTKEHSIEPEKSQSKDYHIRVHGKGSKPEWMKIEGEPVDIKGLEAAELFIHRPPQGGGWKISSNINGMYVAWGNTKKEALADLQQKGKPEAILRSLKKYIDSHEPVGPTSSSANLMTITSIEGKPSPIVSKEEADKQIAAAKIKQAAALGTGTSKEAMSPQLKGWLDTLPNKVVAGKSASTLARKMNYDGEVMTRRDFVEKAAEKGWEPKYTHIYGKGGGDTWLIGDFQATKTEVDYLNYIKSQKAPAHSQSKIALVSSTEYEKMNEAAQKNPNWEKASAEFAIKAKVIEENHQAAVKALNKRWADSFNKKSKPLPYNELSDIETRDYYSALVDLRQEIFSKYGLGDVPVSNYEYKLWRQAKDKNAKKLDRLAIAQSIAGTLFRDSLGADIKAAGGPSKLKYEKEGELDKFSPRTQKLWKAITKMRAMMKELKGEAIPQKAQKLGTLETPTQVLMAHSKAESKGTTYGGNEPVYQGPASKYEGQGEFYYEIPFMKEEHGEPWIIAYAKKKGGATPLKTELKAKGKKPNITQQYLYGGFPMKLADIIKDLDEQSGGDIKFRDTYIMGLTSKKPLEGVEPISYAEFKKKTTKTTYRKKKVPEAKDKVTVTLSTVNKAQAKRSKTARATDGALLATHVLPPSQRERWLKNPGRFDIKGVDTPHQVVKPHKAKRGAGYTRRSDK